MRDHHRLPQGALLGAVILAAAWLQAQEITVDTSAAGRRQLIDGFGTCLSGSEGRQSWWQQLYFDDLGASMVRVDMTPSFRSPYSDFTYNSPWFHNHPALPGPDGNNVRTYTGPADYSRLFAGRNAPIAVMGPNIDENIGYFSFPEAPGAVARAGEMRRLQLGDFKLFGSMWSPAPWVKVSSGNSIQNQSGVLPANGAPWPFIWAGNFAGGRLNVSGTPLAVFDDSALGGAGPTSALTQFARCAAAYVLGFQRRFQVRFYALSIQNELNFEEFYNSCAYPLSSQYITALKAVRAEFDKYPELAGIRLIGPEDLLGGDAYGMWQYGGGADAVHKNLQYLQNIAMDPVANAALDFFCIHGYADDGVTASGSTPTEWNWWLNGWSSSPAPGIPSNVKGTADYGRKSWMTETSGESPAWLSPATGFPGQGAWSIALKLHQALTAGGQSAWAYWQLTDGNVAGPSTLTDATQRGSAMKFIAAKHFFRFIRPNSTRVAVTISGAQGLSASAYLGDAEQSLTVVLINGQADAVRVQIRAPSLPAGLTEFQTYTSDAASRWVSNAAPIVNGIAEARAPAYGICTLYGEAGRTPRPPAIIQSPEPVGAQAGSSAQFNCAATGEIPLSCQWVFNDVPLPGATNTSLVLTNVQPYQAGRYAVVVTNSAGSLASFPAALTVNGAATLPAITPDISARLADGRLELSFVANPGRIYSWWTSANLVSWTELTRFVSGTASVQYAAPATPAPDTRYYRVSSP